MATNTDFLAGDALRRQKLVNITAVTSYPALQIQAIGSYAYYKITVAASGDITLSGDDTDGTTTLYTIDLSTPAAAVDTFGELKDYINQQTGGHFRCYLIGVLGSESTDNTLQALSATHLKTSASSGVPANGLTLYIDQAVLLDTGFAITNNKFISQPALGFDSYKTGWLDDELCENELNYLYFNVATQTNNGTIKIYSCNDTPSVNTSTLIWSNAYAAATPEEHPSAAPDMDRAFVRSNLGHRLCIKFDAVDTAQSSTLDIHATGHTKHLTGQVRVLGANYTGCV